MKKILPIISVIFFGLTVFAQAQIKITGIVKSLNNGKPIVANVTIKQTKKGTTTGTDGAYSLTDVPKSATLVFSAVGFTKQEITVNNRTIINISLESDDKDLGEVMVVAYGTAKKETFTGSAAVIKQSAIKDVPTTSFENALVGKVAGVQVTSSSGQAGATSSIRIRGVGSINASNEPLYVIDGVPVISGNAGQMSDYTNASNNSMNSINPADIETITILKDAAASSLYGSRAANGVVLITTKKGKEGKTKINFKSSVGITPTWATDNYEIAGIDEQTSMLYRILYDSKSSTGSTEAVSNTYALTQLNTKFNKHGYKFTTDGTALNSKINISGMTDGLVNRGGTYFDWEDALFGTAIYQTNDLSFSGGNENTTYYTSLSYTNDQSRVKSNQFDRISGRVNLGQKIGKYLELTTNVNFARSGQTGFNDTRNTGSNYFFQSRNLLWGFYWPTDYKTGQPFTARYGSLAQNTVYYDNEWENSSITRRITANETATVKILPELNLKSVFSYDNAQVKDHIYYSAIHFNGATDNGSVTEMTTNTNKLVSSTTLNYNKQFGLHNIGLLGGFEVEKNQTDFMRSKGTNMATSTLHTVATAGKLDANAYDWGNSIVSVLSRAEYNYNQKYYASASLRRDGSSKLAPEARWGNFWSIAGSWRINNESFMKDIKEISSLRLRASYGVNGTLPSNDFIWRSLTGYGLKYLEAPGGGISNSLNPDLRWETNYSTNIALEFGLFGQRLTGTIEYFNRDSKDLLQDVRTSMTTGFSSNVKNIGQMNNRGLEIEIGGDIIKNNQFRWGASVNAAFIKSKIVKLNDGSDITWNDPTGGDARAQYVYREGQPTYSFYGYEWAGVNPANGKNVYYVNAPGDANTGDFQYNGRGATYTYSKANYIILGNAMPNVYGGINTDFEYKGFTLTLGFNYKIGGKIYDGGLKDVSDDGYYWERIRAQYTYDNMWTAENPNGTVPKLDGNDLMDPMQYSSRQMFDASFIRLKNVTLGYSIPKNIINKIGGSSARVYFNGSNLLTFSKYKIADPEVNQYGTRGWETPFGKTYTFGLEFSF